MSNVLTRICLDKMDHVDLCKQKISLSQLKENIFDQELPRGFLSSLERNYKDKNVPLIAEVKKASPSKGVIREDFNPIEIAKTYEKAGASCLSVLTDTPYFQGKDDYLIEIKKNVTLPILRKDFMIDPYQIYESRSLGADCILIIMAALEDDRVKELYDLSKSLGMDVLVEVHDHEELDRALKLSPDLVGVNSRNLKTLEVDIQTAHEMIQRIPDSAFKIAESGISNHADILSLQSKGAQGFLVGESLMREENILQATKNLLGTN